MAVAKSDPNTIFLGGSRTQINTFPALGTIKPGMLIELDKSGSNVGYKVATTDIAGPAEFATEQIMMNKGVNDAYAQYDLIEASVGHSGAEFWARIQSGQTIAEGDLLGSAGSGYLKAGATVARVRAEESKTAAFTGDTMIRVTVL